MIFSANDNTFLLFSWPVDSSWDRSWTIEAAQSNSVDQMIFGVMQ